MILRVLNALNGLLLGSCLIWLLLLHRSLIQYPYPMELSEGSMMMSTRLIMQGENPWAVERQPQANNCYGAGYNFVAAGFGKVFGVASLASHRALSCLFILLSCLLIYAAALRMGLHRLEAGWLSLMQYVCLLYYTSPLARPDAQGMFLFLAAILLPMVFNTRSYAWYLSGFLICLAALTKLYFILAFPFLFLFLVTQRRWLDLARLGMAFGASAAVAILVIARWGDTYPYAAFLVYFSEVIENHADYARAQLWTYGFRFFIVLLPVFGCVLWAAMKRSKLAPALPWLLFSCVSLFIFILKLGGNYGSQMVYLFHLNLPFALLALAALVPSATSSRPWFAWIFAVQALILIPQISPPRPDADLMALTTLQAVENEAAKSRRLFAPWELACWQMDHGREVQDVGHRSSFAAALQAARRWPYWFTRSAELERQVKLVEDQEDHDLETGAYDLVLLSREDFRHRALLIKKYELLGSVVLPYAQGKAIEVLGAYQLKRPGAI